METSESMSVVGGATNKHGAHQGEVSPVFAAIMKERRESDMMNTSFSHGVSAGGMGGPGLRPGGLMVGPDVSHC